MARCPMPGQNMRVVEAFEDLVRPGATIGMMSPGQRSITNNVNRNYEVYRGSKAATIHVHAQPRGAPRWRARTLLLMAPGWVRTDMGGPQAKLGIEHSIPNLVNTVDPHAGRAGLHYVDYLGRTVPWRSA